MAVSVCNDGVSASVNKELSASDCETRRDAAERFRRLLARTACGRPGVEIAGRGLVACVVVISLAAIVAGDLVLADGPADNNPQTVRRIPKLGVDVPPEREASLRAQLATLQNKLLQLQQSKDPVVSDLLPDVMIFERAVRVALDYQEFFDIKELDRGHALLAEGISRADQLLVGNPVWHTKPGLIVRGYVSRIDKTVQPYGLVVPGSYAFNHSTATRCDLWFHGRGETLSEVNFIWDRMRNAGQFTPRDTIVLHPYGRYSNAFKFAGEVDVLEALEDVQQKYCVDEDRISVRGFSMGGAACWQFATHYSDRWFAANPGAGFSETPRFLNVFQNETLQPKPWERTLWNLYDCDKWALNLSQCPTIAYSGEEDRQKQAADVMEEALAEDNIRLRHVIGRGMGHRYDDVSKQIVDASLRQLARFGRQRVPEVIRFETYTLKYNRMHWVTVDAMGEHWKPATVIAQIDRSSPFLIRISIYSDNITQMSLNFPAGSFAPQDVLSVEILPLKGTGSGYEFTEQKPFSDGSFEATYHENTMDGWLEGNATAAMAKRHHLQGPIDDAFMDSFVFVRPTGTAINPAVGQWVDAELKRAVEHWRRHFRGDARVVDDTEVTDELVQQASLILWGDPSSNCVTAKIVDQLPIRWTDSTITVGEKDYAADTHAPILIYPNPVNPDRYVVLNSSFTFREYAYLNNARQVPMLPDWAIVNLEVPPGPVWPGEVVAADFFDESWQLKKTSADR